MKRAQEHKEDNQTSTSLEDTFSPLLLLDLGKTESSLQCLHDLKSNTSVHILRISIYSHLCSFFFNPINEALALNTSIYGLHIQGNGEHIPLSTFPMAFQRPLQTLRFYNCVLIGPTEEIIEYLRSNTTLKNLDLSRCCVSSLLGIAEGIQHNSSITNLSLCDIKLYSLKWKQSIKKIGKIIQFNKNITNLKMSIGKPNIEDKLTILQRRDAGCLFVKTIVKSMKQNNTIVSANLDGCEFGADALGVVEACLERNKYTNHQYSLFKVETQKYIQECIKILGQLLNPDIAHKIIGYSLNFESQADSLYSNYMELHSKKTLNKMDKQKH